MKVLPLCFLGSLTEDDLLRHECSDRIWVGRATFEQFTTGVEDAGVTAIVLLKNRVEQSVPAVIYAAHYDDENTIYAPAWIISELFHDTEIVTCERYMPSLGTQITLLPHSSDHFRDSNDPETLLRDGFEQYTCLLRGNTYQIWLGTHSFSVTLTDLLPAHENVICIRGSELRLELLAPLDRPVTPPQAPSEPSEPSEPPAPPPPSITDEERRAIIAAATRRRLAASVSQSSK